MGGHVACTEEIRNSHNISVGKPDRVKRPRHRWEDNITKVLKRNFIKLIIGSSGEIR
jgi:protein required for attachment to host cells